MARLVAAGVRMKEEWRDIPGYEGHFQITKDGEIRSLNRTIKVQKGFTRSIKGRVLSPSMKKNGYYQIGLRHKGIRKWYNIHQLVALTFLGPRPEGFCVNHKDGVKTNNNINNLEYCTMAQNTQHAYAIGLAVGPRGEKSGTSKITTDQVVDIKYKLSVDGKTPTEVSKEMNIPYSIVKKIHTNIRWKHIPWPKGYPPKIKRIKKKTQEDVDIVNFLLDQKTMIKDIKEITGHSRTFIDKIRKQRGEL